MAERPIPFQPGYASVSFEHGVVGDKPVIAMFVHTANATVCTMWDAESLGKVLDAGMTMLDGPPPAPGIVVAGPDVLHDLGMKWPHERK